MIWFPVCEEEKAYSGVIARNRCVKKGVSVYAAEKSVRKMGHGNAV